jgi:hypothetical protein
MLAMESFIDKCERTGLDPVEVKDHLLEALQDFLLLYSWRDLLRFIGDLT